MSSHMKFSQVKTNAQLKKKKKEHQQSYTVVYFSKSQNQFQSIWENLLSLEELPTGLDR